jgi:hypothetical protein
MNSNLTADDILEEEFAGAHARRRLTSDRLD